MPLSQLSYIYWLIHFKVLSLSTEMQFSTDLALMNTQPQRIKDDDATRANDNRGISWCPDSCKGKCLNLVSLTNLFEILYLRLISSFHELLQKDHSFTIHHRNIQSLAIELYKIKENLSNEIMSSIFPPRLIKYNLRTQSDFFKNPVNVANVVQIQYDFSLLRFGKWFQWKWKIWRVLKILKIKLEIGNQMDVTVNYAKTLCQI